MGTPSLHLLDVDASHRVRRVHQSSDDDSLANDDLPAVLATVTGAPEDRDGDLFATVLAGVVSHPSSPSG